MDVLHLGGPSMWQPGWNLNQFGKHLRSQARHLHRVCLKHCCVFAVKIDAYQSGCHQESTSRPVKSLIVVMKGSAPSAWSMPILTMILGVRNCAKIRPGIRLSRPAHRNRSPPQAPPDKLKTPSTAPCRAAPKPVSAPPCLKLQPQQSPQALVQARPLPALHRA